MANVISHSKKYTCNTFFQGLLIFTAIKFHGKHLCFVLAIVYERKKMSNQLINLDSVHTSVNYWWLNEDLVH